MEYIPDGLSKAQWDKIKAKEKQTKKLKMDGTSGMKFRSRSMADFLEGREKGIYKYNMVRFFLVDSPGPFLPKVAS